MNYELKVKKRGKEGWNEHIPETSSDEEFEEKLSSIIDEHGAETKGSYGITLMINRGYGNNPETGATVQLNWKGALAGILDLIHRSKKAGT